MLKYMSTNIHSQVIWEKESRWRFSVGIASQEIEKSIFQKQKIIIY